MKFGFHQQANRSAERSGTQACESHFSVANPASDISCPEGESISAISFHDEIRIGHP
jgi:hypothetical protein